MLRKCFFLPFLFTVNMLFAQNYNLSGTISSCEDKTSLPNAILELKEITKTVYSDANGHFSIKSIPKGKYTLTAWYQGYEVGEYIIYFDNDINNFSVSLCEKVYNLDQVVITATRTERKLKDVPITTQVITSKTIEKSQLANFRDFLEQELAGVEFTNNGGYANINMMGLGGKYVLFLIDGERMAGETFDNIDYNRIDMNNIERVEIVKGASSSLYGSNAIGGVINIITKKPKKPLQMSASALYGSNKDQNYNLSVGTKQNWGSLGLSVFYKSREPYLLEDTEPIKQEFENGDIVEQSLSKTYVAGYTDYGFNPKVSIIITPKITTEINSGVYFQERNSGGLDGYKVRDQFYNYRNAMKTTFQLREKSNLILSGSFDNYQKSDFYKLLNKKEKNYENQIWRVGAIYDQQLFNKHTFIFGGEAFSENLLTFMFTSEGAEATRNAQNYSAFTQQEWKLAETFTLVTGARLDYHSQFKSNPTFRLSGMYKVNDDITLRGGYSGGFRAPTLKELFTDWFHPYGGGFQIIGNTEMKAEKSNNFNISSDFNFKKLDITLIAQYSKINNKINANWIANDTVQYVNVGKAKVLSGDISLTYQLRKDLLLKGAYTYVYESPQKRSVTRPHTATLRADYSPKIANKFSPTLSFSGKYFSSMNTYGTVDISDTDNTTGIDSNTEEYKIYYEPYAIWRLQLATPLWFGFTASAGINNLFNYKTKFSSFYSNISPGRTYYIGLKWDI